jgi:TolB-like protein/Flp pilus assembly protein TadD
MLTPRGPKVLDFGIASVRGGLDLTQAGHLVGTPLFMSPEQLQGRPPDNRTDLWALGVILYLSLTGEMPFAAESLPAMTQAVLGAPAPPPSRRNPAVTPAIDFIVDKLLRKDPQLRYARAEDLIADLASCSGSGAAGAATVEVARPAATAAPRIAVLYFEVLSADPDDAFLAAGLTEDLIVDLARVEGLRVAARGEVQPFRGRDVPPRTVARELGVDWIVQGSVRRAGQRARISAQLVRASDGHASWAERFDRTIEDLFDVQAEVSRRIVDALQVSLRPAEREMLERAPTRNRQAYEHYLRGRALLDRHRRAANLQAETELARAVDLDPAFVLAHAALAECYGIRGASWWAGREVVSLARPHALRALELDPALPEAHMALGYVLRLEGDAEGLLREVNASGPADTSDSLLMQWAGWSLMSLGRDEEAYPILLRGHRLHPRNYRMLSGLIDCCATLHRHDEEKRLLDEIQELLVDTIAREPENADARVLLAISLAQTGDPGAAFAQAERAIAVDPDDGRVRYNAACTFAQGGEPERAMEQLVAAVQRVPNYLTDWVVKDPDLASLRERPDFVKLFGKG